MPTLQPTYLLHPGRSIEIEVQQPDGGRAVIVGTLDRVSEAASGGVARRLVVTATRVMALPAGE